MRPPVEHYARCSVTVGDLVIEPGIELRDGDDFDRLVLALRAMAEHIGHETRWHDHGDRLESCKLAATTFEAMWPGRAYFVELHDADHGVWSQTYQPYGMPRNT